MSRRKGFRDIQLNGINNADCPCRNCGIRYSGCHPSCIKYIDWKQSHEAKLNIFHEQRAVWDAYYEGQQRRDKSLGRRSLNIGRKKKGKGSNNTRDGT